MQARKLRIVHWGTGTTGAVALRQIIMQPRFELVGLHVHSDEKKGCDAGDLCGVPPVGVLATRDLDALLGLRPDCFCYMATEWGRKPDDVIDEITRILAAGINVVTTTFPPLVYAKGLGPDMVRRLEDACTKGRCSFYATGIEPGFTADALPLTLSSMSQSIRRIHVHEHMNVGHYPEPRQAIAFGFGMTREAYADIRMPGMWTPYWQGTIHLLADGLNLHLDGLREVWDVDLTAKEIDLGWIKLPPGTIGASYFEIHGLVGGEAKLVISHCYSLHDDVGTRWMVEVPAERRAWRNTRIIIEGEPEIRLEMSLGSTSQAPAGVTATASRAVNSIPVVCAAAPGIRTFLDLPPIVATAHTR